MATNRYCVEIAKRGTAGCKNCKQKIEKGLVRIGKIVPNPFTDAGGDMKQWYHVQCMFQALSRARATTKKIEGPEDLEGFDDIGDKEKEEVLKYINEFSLSGKNTQKTPKKTERSHSGSPSSSRKRSRSRSPKESSTSPSRSKQKTGRDDSFREFRRLCASIAEESSYNKKTEIVSDFFRKGPRGNGFDGDLYLWIKLLLPGAHKRVYNIQSKQLVKLFSQIFETDEDEMLENLEEGDCAETVQLFFENSSSCRPLKKSSLTVQEVDEFLEELTKITKEAGQMQLLEKVTKRCTSNDLKMFVRLIKHDLRIGAGPKHILEALHPTAYEAFQASRNLKDVVKRFLKHKNSGSSVEGLVVKTSLMTPVLPMLAQPCRSIKDAFKRCPNGLLVEIKYDGERVQVHKQGSEFSYFSRSLKPVMSHKIAHFKDYIPKAFPYGKNLILDSEILLVDNDGKPLPFGSLGAHKKASFQDATVCLFVFDCMYFNDESLMKKPLEERRKILHENMKPVKNHIMFSEQKFVKEPEELKKIIESVIKQGLEGLVIKDKMGIYEPGKRHWLKVKKDYLKNEVSLDFIKEGSLPDSVDLVVLGAYYGTGNKGGMKSIFLMGCLNEKTGKWCTVTKVHGGLDDDTLASLQKKLKMVKISKDVSKIPSWLNVNKSLIPDFLIVDPKDSEVWEITGAEFTKAEIHTAGGISIRFPRITRMRKDKTYKEATTFQELQNLYKLSKTTSEVIGLATSPKRRRSSSSDSNTQSSKKKRMHSPSPGKRSRSPSKSRSRSKSPSKKTPDSNADKHKKRRSKSKSKSPTRKKSHSPGTRCSRSKSKSPGRKSSRSPASKSRSRSKSPSKKVRKKKKKK